MTKLTRRELLSRLSAAAAAGAAGAAAGKDSPDNPLPPGGPAALAPAAEQMREMGRPVPGMMARMQTPLTAVTFPRWEPGRIYSPPPPLMGRQMGRVHTLNVPPLGYELDGRVKVFRLIAQPVRQLLTNGRRPPLPRFGPNAADYLPDVERNISNPPGRMMRMDVEPKEILGWGYNGVIPGPTIEITEGDRVRIILTNELPEPTSIHWHGLEVPNVQDGASPEAHPPVPPGGTHVYEFTVYQAGTTLYHSGFNIMKQDLMGLGGLFVMHPRDERSPPDRDFALLHQAWFLAPGNPNPDVTREQPNWTAFSGKVAPSIEPMTVREGERVRIRQGNLSVMNHHPIHFHGYTFTVVGTTGGLLPETARYPDNTILVPIGSTRDIEFTAWNPGIWRFHCHIAHHVMNAMTDMPMGLMPHGGMFTHLIVEPKDPSAPWRHPREKEFAR